MSRLILRMRVRHPLVFVAVAMLLWQSGCSGGKQSERSRETTQESLPAVDIDTAISVDEDRIVIASPAGWTRSPRSSNYLMRFQPGPKKSYPSIVVTGAEAPADLREISSENHKDFVAAIEEELKQGFTDKGSKITKKPVAVTLGDHFGVYYAVPGTAKVEGLSEPIERQCYRLIFSGRMYTVEARAPKGKLDSSARSIAKAVATAMAKPTAQQSEEPTQSEIPTDAATKSEKSTEASEAPVEKKSEDAATDAVGK